MLDILDEVPQQRDRHRSHHEHRRSLKNFARLDEAERKKVNIHEGIDSTLILLHHQLKNRIRIVKEFGDDFPRSNAFRIS